MHLFGTEIEKFLPHRHPILLIDEVKIIQPRAEVVATTFLKNHPDVFNGHFPDFKIMPGVYLIECVAQASAFIFYPTSTQAEQSERGIYYLAQINIAKFIKPVLPDEELSIRVKLIKIFGSVVKVSSLVESNGVQCMSAELILQNSV